MGEGSWYLMSEILDTGHSTNAKAASHYSVNWYKFQADPVAMSEIRRTTGQA